MNQEIGDDEEVKESFQQIEAAKIKQESAELEEDVSEEWKDKVARYLAYIVDGGLLSS